MKEIYIKKNDVNKWIAKYFEKQDLISLNDLLDLIENLDSELERQKEKNEDLQQDLQDNYKPKYKDHYEEYGVSEKDFY